MDKIDLNNFLVPAGIYPGPSSKTEAYPCVIMSVAQAKWKVMKDVMTPGGDPYVYCPICQSPESEHLDGIESPHEWHFCPNCGAKLEGIEY